MRGWTSILQFTFSRLTAAAVVLIATFLPMPTEAQTVKSIYSFSGQNGSGFPTYVTPAQGRDGELYGTTSGTNGSAGSIFKVTTAGKETDLYVFGSEGSNPNGGLTLGTDGNFYGVTPLGGASNSGVLFSVSPSGVYTVLHEFAGGSDGANPIAPPIEASDGNLYGTTVGTNFASTIYRYTLGGQFLTIYSFASAQGQLVGYGLIQSTDGNLYGTSIQGGANGCGTIFKLTTTGTLLSYYSFRCGPGAPVGALLQATDGNFYGTTGKTVFRFGSSGLTTLFTFGNPRMDGEFPSGLTEGSDGNLYGAASGGGRNFGVLFQVTTSGVYSVLHYFTDKDGEYPSYPPVQNSNGLFYGVTSQGGHYFSGSVYSMDMGLSPFVTFVRASGKVGQSAQILGWKLKTVTGVTFNGVPATSFKVVNDTFMTAVVPSGATTGPVVVTTSDATLTSNKNFVVVNP